MKSIGELLRKAREKKKMTIEEVQKVIKVHPKFLHALENDNYEVFSGKVHSKGFLKIYAEYLELNVDEVLALWRRDYEKELESNGKAFKVAKELTMPKFIITPGFLFINLMVIVLVLFFVYLFVQYKTYTGTPKLTLSYPVENTEVTTDILTILGQTDLDVELFLNTQQIALNPDGSFAATIKLKEGLNTLTLKSVTKLGKKTELVRTVIFKPLPRQTVSETSQSTDTVPGSGNQVEQNQKKL